MVTFSEVYSLSEVHGTAESQVTDRGIEASVDLRCAWNVRHAAFEELLLREWPYLPGCGAFAWTGSIRPADGASISDGQGCAYEEAILSVDFIQPEWAEISSTEFRSQSIEPQAEFLTLNHSAFRWGSGSGATLNQDEAPGKLSIGFDIVDTRYRLDDIPATVLTQLGNCNQNPVLMPYLNLTFPAETLMFAAANPTRSLSTFTLPKWDLTCRWSYKPNGWNKYYRAASVAPSKYESIYLLGSATPHKSYPPSLTLPV